MPSLPNLAQRLTRISNELANPKVHRTAGALGANSTLANAIHEFLLAVGAKIVKDWAINGSLEEDGEDRVVVYFDQDKTQFFIDLSLNSAGNIYVYASSVKPPWIDKDLATYELQKLIKSGWDVDKLKDDITGSFEKFMRESKDDR